jgi:hypothetical protein
MSATKYRRCPCGKFARPGRTHECASAIARQLARLAQYRESHPRRWREALSEGQQYAMKVNPAAREARRLSVRVALEAWMRPRRIRRAAIDWQNVGRLHKQGLTWRRLAFMHREPETTFKRWARQELAG